MPPIKPSDWYRAMTGDPSLKLTEETPEDATESTKIYYQKHMSHHLTDDVELDFVDHLRNGFLIRHPNDVLASYLRKHHRATPADWVFRNKLNYSIGSNNEPVPHHRFWNLKTS